MNYPVPFSENVMKPVKDIVGPASSYGFKVFVVAFFKFQGKNVTEYSNWEKTDILSAQTFPLQTWYEEIWFILT